MQKVGRNEPCPCGSGKKYKNCHMTKEETQKRGKGVVMFVLLFVLLISIGAIAAYLNSQQQGAVNADGKQWCETHQTYH